MANGNGRARVNTTRKTKTRTVNPDGTVSVATGEGEKWKQQLSGSPVDKAGNILHEKDRIEPWKRAVTMGLAGGVKAGDVNVAAEDQPQWLRLQTQAAGAQRSREDEVRALREQHGNELLTAGKDASVTQQFDDDYGVTGPGSPRVTASGRDSTLRGAEQGYAVGPGGEEDTRPVGTGIYGDDKDARLGDYMAGIDADYPTTFKGVGSGDTAAAIADFERQQDITRAGAQDTAAKREADRRTGTFQAATDTSFDLGTGNVMGQLTGELQSQLNAFGILEGNMRPSYNFQSMGNPTSAREANMFLSQAIASPANSVSTADIDPQRLQMAQAVMADTSLDSSTRQAAEKYYLAAQAGGEIFMHGGQMLDPANPEDADLIDNFRKIRNGKAAAQNLIENYRVQRQDLLMASAATQNQIELSRETTRFETEQKRELQNLSQEFLAEEYRLDRASKETIGGRYAEATETAATTAADATKAAAEKAAGARVKAARAEQLSDYSTGVDYAGQTIAGKEEQELERIRQQGVQAQFGTESMYKLDKQGNPVEDQFGNKILKDMTVRSREAQELISLQAAEDRITAMEAAGYNIDAIKEKHYADINANAARLREVREQAKYGYEAEVMKIMKTNEGQIAAINLQKEVDMELMETQNRWQSEEANLNRALQLGQMNEVSRASQAKEQLDRDRLALEKEQFNASYILSLANNPALLYHMNESGLLSAFGDTIMGQPIADMIGDLTASIDPGNLPHIQTYNAMSEQQQSMQRYSAAAGYGLDEGRFQEYITSTAPYTRGRQSTVRVGSA